MGRTKEENIQTGVTETIQKNAEGKTVTAEITQKNVEERTGTTETAQKNTEEKANTAGTSQELKDIVEKEFISFPDIAADVINVLLYQGNEMTTAESLLDGPTETVYQGIGRLRNQLEDLCKYEMADGKVNIMYLIANQSKVDKKMLLRKAGYVGGAYREQYGCRADAFPVIEFVLHWGSARWKDNRDTWGLFEGWHFPKEKWKYVDKMKLHLFEMRYLPERVRKLFKSDMRIVVDYLAEGDGYRSDRKVVHKAALIKMIKTYNVPYKVDTARERDCLKC